MILYYQKNKFNKITCYSFFENANMLKAEITEDDLKLIENNLGKVAVKEINGKTEFTVEELSQEELDILTNLKNKLLPEEIRYRRKTECFPYINRGYFWLKNLTDEQKNELEVWYQSWLDAPATLLIPNKPEWLK